MRYRLVASAAFLLLAASVAPATPVRAEAELVVFAAASLAEAFREIGARFEAEHAGTRVRLHFAGSQQLAVQIEQGAGADVFASADDRWMDYVVERRLAADSAATFARNRLAVVIPKSNPARIGGLADLARRGVKLVLAAEAVPAGAYARAMLRSLERQPGFAPGFAEKTLRNVVSNEENVRAVLGKVQLGEADAGVVYRSDVVGSARRFVRTIEVPDDASPIAHYPIAAVRGGRVDAAREFVSLVRSPWGRGVLARHGFLAP